MLVVSYSYHFFIRIYSDIRSYYFFDTNVFGYSFVSLFGYRYIRIFVCVKNLCSSHPDSQGFHLVENTPLLPFLQGSWRELLGLQTGSHCCYNEEQTSIRGGDLVS